jgi:hypothetical protein
VHRQFVHANAAAAIADDDRRHRAESWLTCGIVVNIVPNTAHQPAAATTGTIQRVLSHTSAAVKLSGSNSIITVTQQHCSTIIPSINKPVMIVNGRGRGCLAVLQSRDLNAFYGDVKMVEGRFRNSIFRHIEFRDMCKADTTFFTTTCT